MRRVLIILLLLCHNSYLHAQKIGCINSVALLQSLPEKVAVDTFFARYKKANSDSMAKMVMQYQKLGMSLQVDHSKDGSRMMEDLQQLQTEIESFQSNFLRSEDSVRKLLYQPITDKLNKVVSYLARKDEYDFVIDISIPNYRYYGIDNRDLTDKIRVVMKYGMKEVE